MPKHPLSLGNGDEGLDEIETLVCNSLSLESARLVRVLRVDLGCTWRKVAALYAYVYPNAGVVGGHQLYGESLCRQAANLLKEDPEDTPWN